VTGPAMGADDPGTRGWLLQRLDRYSGVATQLLGEQAADLNAASRQIGGEIQLGVRIALRIGETDSDQSTPSARSRAPCRSSCLAYDDFAEYRAVPNRLTGLAANVEARDCHPGNRAAAGWPRHPRPRCQAAGRSSAGHRP
jgi:hypothetical protein